MITIQLKLPTLGSEKTYIEGACLSTDTKPLDVANGSKLMEMDTATMYLFDEAAKTWRAWE